jgi:hypothetical protein
MDVLKDEFRALKAAD